MNQSLFITKNGLLILLFTLWLCFFTGPNYLFGGLTFAAIAVYHLLTDRRFSAEHIEASGLMHLHLGVYLLLCTALVWATTGVEESNYWIVYFLPVIVAASNLTLWRTMLTCLVASLLFLLTVRYATTTQDNLLSNELAEFLTLCTTFFVVGVVVNSFSQQHRDQLAQQKRLNERLRERSAELQKSLDKLRETEEILRRKDRLAALGEMAAGLAHEIRNPLGVISSSSQLLRSRFDADDNAAQLLNVIREESSRLNALVNDFLKFGHPAQPQLLRQDVAALVQRAVDHLYTIAVARNVQICCTLPDTPVELEVDGDMLQQLLLNLLLNAIEACNDQGRVRVTVEDQDQQICIVVDDNGCGIAAEIMATIFNPFFTTKADGTGLGLATSHKIAEMHGGEIQAESIQGEGSCFRVILPRQRQ